MNQTIEYYNKNSDDFYNNTVHLDLSELYQKFIQHIPEDGTILDLGCGSGRDSLYFKQKGYIVTSIDASKEMVRLSSKLVGQPTLQLRIEDINFKNEFNGIWACASLLHIDKSSTKNVFTTLAKALKNDGCLYVSYKYGIGTNTKEDRIFNNYNEISFREVISEVDDLDIYSHWITYDLRTERNNERWLNLILKKPKS